MMVRVDCCDCVANVASDAADGDGCIAIAEDSTQFYSLPAEPNYVKLFH